MSKIYLQEYITPVPNKYIIVGADGNLTTGDIATDVFPLIRINTPGVVSSLQVYKGSIYVDTNQISNTLYICNPTEFGIWTVSCIYNGNVLTDTINVTDLTSYSVTFS